MLDYQLLEGLQCLLMTGDGGCGAPVPPHYKTHVMTCGKRVWGLLKRVSAVLQHNRHAPEALVG